jgi:hypothetical protein
MYIVCFSELSYSAPHTDREPEAVHGLYVRKCPEKGKIITESAIIELINNKLIGLHETV